MLNFNKLKTTFGINTTRDARYDEMGITGYIHRYAGSHRKVLNVIDVGCSTGIATKAAQECLKKHGTEIKTMGIDNSSGIKPDAIKNLDCFEELSVVSSGLNKYVDKADVVICANVANMLYKMFSTRDTAEIIKSCVKLLKKDGILVTDAPDANHTPGISRLEWQCVNLCPKRDLNYKLSAWRKSSAYRRI